MTVHEISLTEYIDTGRATIQARPLGAIWRDRRADAFRRLDRRSKAILGPLDCDCDACQGLRWPGPGIVERESEQLGLPGMPC